MKLLSLSEALAGSVGRVIESHAAAAHRPAAAFTPSFRTEHRSMNCPTCKDVALIMTERQGVEIDYCPQCRGVWLDRGELDKIIDRSERDLAAVPAAAPPPAQPFLPPQGSDAYRWGSDCDDRSRQGQHGGYRKKSLWKDLFD